MTDTITTLSLITLAQEYRGDVVRQINRRTVLLKLIPIVKGSGLNCSFVPEADGQIAENFSEGADAANFGGDAQSSAVLNWGLYRANIHVSNLSMDAAAGASSPLGNRGLWARNMVNASAKLASTLNAALYVGPGTGTTIAGLDVAIGDAANQYATIDRSQGGNAYFRPYVIDPGADTAITFADLRKDIAAIYKACGENPDVAVCDPDTFNTIGALFDNTRRQVEQVQTARGAIRLDFGWQALEVDGVMFIKDKDAPAKSIYYLNTNHVRLEYLPAAGAVPMAEEQTVEADDGFGPAPLGFTYEKLAKTGASEKAEVRTTLQLVVDRPNSCGVRRHVKLAA